MSVLKNLQDLSDLEFYKCAEKLQDEMTDFCLRDFGLKKSPRGNLIEYNAYKSVRSTDALYKSLFWGEKWENPKKRKSTVKESKAK